MVIAVPVWNAFFHWILPTKHVLHKSDSKWPLIKFAFIHFKFMLI